MPVQRDLVQRLVEIFSEHRRSEDWAQRFLARGHRVGIMASTDNHYGNPGYVLFTWAHDSLSWERVEYELEAGSAAR